MTGSDPAPRRRDQDDDPTGVHQLLSSLPHPGPMPEELVARINALLAEETERREGPEDAVSYALFAGRTRTRRVSWPLRGAAAAAALVLIGGAAFAGQWGGGSPTQIGMLQPSAATPTPSSTDLPDPTVPGPSASGGDGVQGERPDADAARGPASFHQSGLAYTAANLRSQAQRLRSAPPATLAPLAAESPHLGPIATPVGLAPCLGALGLPADAAASVDLATYDGKPVAIIVTALPDGAQVHVVRRACGASGAQLVAGPYRL